MSLHNFKVGDVLKVSFDGSEGDLEEGQWIESTVRATQADRIFLMMGDCVLIFDDDGMGRITSQCSIYLQVNRKGELHTGFSGPIDLDCGTTEPVQYDWAVTISKVS